MSFVILVAFAICVQQTANANDGQQKEEMTTIAAGNLSFRALNLKLTENDKERFFAKVKKTKGCWIWDGARWDNGYGVFTKDGKNLKAHRISWLIHFGKIPAHLCICHTCDVKWCVRPDHLFIGTHGDNMRDMERKGRSRHLSGDDHAYRKNPELHARGEQCHNSIFTKDQVLEIRRLYSAGGIYQKELAEMFGTDQGNISAITRRITWKHI